MWPFRKETETRSEEPSAVDILPRILGQRLSEGDVESIPALSAAVEFVTTQAASVPMKLYRIDSYGHEEPVRDARVETVNLNTGDMLNAHSARKALYRDYLLHGAGYWFKDSFDASGSLYYVRNRDVSVTKGADPIFKTATLMVQGRQYREFQFVKLLRHTTDGVTGHGVLEENDSFLRGAYAALELQRRRMENGGKKRGFFQSSVNLSKGQLDSLRKSIERMYAGESNSVLLNNGIAFKEAADTSVEMQLKEIIELNRVEVASIFGLPAQILTGTATMEQFGDALRQAVVPLLDDMEAALNRDLLLENEKGLLVWRADTSELLKGSMRERFEAYKLAVEGGWISKNEIRAKEHLKQVNGLDVITMTLADVAFDVNTGQMVVLNTGMQTDMNAGTQVPAGMLTGNEPGGEKEQSKNEKEAE